MPIKMEAAHFVLGFVHVTKKTTYVFDSGGYQQKKLAFRLNKLMQEVLSENDGWSWVRNSYGPRQTNGCDCGLYVCIIANYISIGLGTNDIQNTRAREYRENLALEIYEGKAI